MKDYLKIILLMLFFFLLTPLFVKAIKIGPIIETKPIEEIINVIFKFIFWVGVALVPIMAIVAAYFFLTSGGDPEKLRTAKRIIFWTLIGLLILLLGKGIPSIIKQLIGEGPTPTPTSTPTPPPQTCASIGYYCCTPDGCRGLNRSDLDSTCGAGQKCCQYPCCPNLSPGEACPLTCQNLCWCAAGGKWISPGQKCTAVCGPATCENCTTSADCTAAGCRWCSRCGGTNSMQINKWGQDKCTNKVGTLWEDCGYECALECGAECGYVGPGSECTAEEGGFHCIGCDCVSAGPPGPCLKEGELVLTPDGFKKIEDLKEGDYVIGYEDGEKVKSKILEKSVHEGEFKLYFYRGYWFTGNHLVYLDDYKEFKRVDELSYIKKNYKGKVYNIQTETQNYFGENGLLIHNK